MSVSQDLHEKVLRRDGQCFYKCLDDEHICKDTWGQIHPSTDLRRLTVDHVWLIPGGIRGKRAPDDEQHLVAMCARMNVEGPSREVRDAERDYLLGLYPGEII